MVAISVLAIVALGTLVSSEVHQDDGNFVGHSDRRLVRSLKSTKRGKGKKRQSKAKSGKSKGAKSYPTANPTSRPTSDPSPPEQSQLKQDIAAATSKRATDRQSYGWVDENERNCVQGSDTYQSCLYSIYDFKKGFECKCKLTRTAEVFDTVDANGDRQITWLELQAHLAKQTCEFPFKRIQNDGSIKEYTECTLDDEPSGYSWCSTKQNLDGFHSKGNYKYCSDEGNQQAWFEALEKFDENDDGMLAFPEASRHARETRRLRERMLDTIDITDIFGANRCNDCITPLYCQNLAIATIDNHCRNEIKTVPLNDDPLLRLLATAMGDIYCYQDPVPESVEGCPYELRTGVQDWLKRGPVTLYDKSKGMALNTALLCIASMMSTSVILYNAGRHLYSSLFGGEEGVIDCSRLFDEEVSDGRDMLQYATYEIIQGPHQGKKILAFMGTDFTNFEQALADLMKNMADEATKVALEISPDYITGHSLGGILTEMVTSKTGIPGASFAALGAFDAFSTLDIKAYELFFNSSISVYGTEYETSFEAEEANKLTAEGYDKSEVQEVIKEKYGEDLRTYSIAFEYMGLIADTLHDGVPFEVVINAKDRLATAFLVNSLEGSACSHISRSCDIRWLCFPDMPPVQYTLGHSSVHYASHAASEFIVGWGGIVPTLQSMKT